MKKTNACHCWQVVLKHLCLFLVPAYTQVVVNRDSVVVPRMGSGAWAPCGLLVERIDPLRFMAGCRTGRPCLSSALSSVSSECVLCCLLGLCCIIFVFCLLVVFVCCGANDWMKKTRLRYDLYVDGDVKPTHSLTRSLCCRPTVLWTAFSALLFYYFTSSLFIVMWTVGLM